MEREVGGGIGMGNTRKPMAVSFQCMTKSTTNKKKKRDPGEQSCLFLPFEEMKRRRQSANENSAVLAPCSLASSLQNYEK